MMASADPARPRRPGAAAPPTGLRERKKQKTKEAIQRVALRLFQKQGYDETTIEQIAAAVEISPSTFFNYFPTKEDVVGYDIYDPMMIAAFLESPKDESLNATIRRVLEQLGDAMEQDKDMIYERGKLFLEVPELRGRMWDELERTNVLFAKLLAQRTGRSPDDFELRVTVRVLTSAIYEAAMEWWRGKGRESLATIANRALDVVGAGARLSALSTARPKTTRPRTRRR
jgi:AcrR family transcriptional regulator